MKLDHLVMNIDRKYQTDPAYIDQIRSGGFPYEPKWGKGTAGFKASNLWIGREYLEMVSILKQDGGGWMPEWVESYHQGYRGPVCLMLDVADIHKVYAEMQKREIALSEPQFLKFKWGFGLFTRTMPWLNAYFPAFEGFPFQIGLQQMKDQKSEEYMCAYMVPNARENGMTGIASLTITAPFTDADLRRMDAIFPDCKKADGMRIVSLPDGKQTVKFLQQKEISFVAEIRSSAPVKKEPVVIENVTLSVFHDAAQNG